MRRADVVQRRRQTLANILCLCGSLLVAALLVEIMCAVFVPDVAVTVDIFGRRIAARTKPHFDPATHDNNLFWILRPNQIGREKLLDDFNYAWSINSLGVRDDEVSEKQPGVKRILVIGDSQTFGIGVDHAETFCSLLEERLNAVGKVTVEVINAGTHAYGTAEEFFRLQQLAAAVQPDIVITALHADNILINDQGNDLWNNKDWLQRETRVIDAQPVLAASVPLQEQKYVRLIEFLGRHSHCLRFLYHHYQALRNKGYIDNAEKFFKLPPKERNLETIWEPTRALLTRIDEYSRKNCNARHFILYIPGPLSLKFGDQSAEEELAPLEIDSVSAYKALREAQETMGMQLTYKHDAHYNASGHKVIADVLLKHIRQNGWLEASSLSP